MARHRHRKNPQRKPVRVIAIIPAKGGSVSIPYKNLIRLGGKTLLKWAVDVAFAAQTIDLVAVTTEDARIARHARRYGALVIPEPPEYARPDCDDSGWYRNAAQWLKREKRWTPELWVNLRPTGPLRTPEDVDACVRHVVRTGADGLKTVVPSPIPPYKMWTTVPARRRQSGYGASATEAPAKAGEVLTMKPLLSHPYRLKHGPDIPRQRAQRLFPTYWQDAQIDITRRKFILSEAARKYGNCFGTNIHGYIMDERKIVDIDTPADLRQAAKIWRTLERERRAKTRRRSRTKKYELHLAPHPKTQRRRRRK